MELHAKLVRSQLNFFKPLAENCSLELTRKGQDKLDDGHAPAGDLFP